MSESNISLTNQNTNLYVNGLNTVPVGSIMCYAGLTAPEGWLFCDGRTVNRDSYKNLFETIGTIYGSTTLHNFKLPNLQQKFPIGKSSGLSLGTISGPSTSTLGGTGGSSTLTLTESQIPSHSHTGTIETSGNHSHTGSAVDAGSHTHSISDPGHTHSIQDAYWSEAWGSVGGGYIGSNTGLDYDNKLYVRTVTSGSSTTGITVDSNGTHSHTLSINDAGSHTHNINISNSGNGDSINIMNPYIVLNYIIRY